MGSAKVAVWLCYNGESTLLMGERVVAEAGDFVNSSGAGSTLVVGLVGTSLVCDGTVILEWLPGVVVDEGVEGSLRELAKQK